MKAWSAGDGEAAEQLLRRALLTGSPDEKNEARYRLGLLYAGRLEETEESAARTGILAALSVLGFGEQAAPDARLRALLCEVWAAEGRWNYVLELAGRPAAELDDPASLARTRMMNAAATAALGGEEALAELLLEGVNGEARQSLLRILELRPELRGSLGRETGDLVSLAEALEAGWRPGIEAVLFRVLAGEGRAAAGTPLFLEAVRKAGYGSAGRRLLATVEELLSVSAHDRERRMTLLESAGFLSRRAGAYLDAFGYYDRALALAKEVAGKESGGDTLQRLLWYRFDSLVRLDPVAAVEELPRVLHDVSDQDYFDDVFGTLLDRLLADGAWALADRAAWLYGPAFSSGTASRYYYIAARAREEGLLPDDGRSAELYRRILERSPDGALSRYYRLLTADRMNSGAAPALFYPAARKGAAEAPLPRRELLENLIAFGLSDDAEEELERLESMGWTAPRGLTVALAGERIRNGHYLNALRRLERFLSREGLRDEAELRLLYPRPYLEIFSRVTEREKLDPAVFYALVREESHFTADIYSHAGAVGLSQLMPSTAADVASRMGLGLPTLKELHDPGLNLSIGAWYLSHLISRTGTLADALFAYNGGLTRVRRWRESNAALPDDLFPELIPFPETQHYGRKLLVSSSIYRYLYPAGGVPDGPGLVDRFFPDR